MTSSIRLNAADFVKVAVFVQATDLIVDVYEGAGNSEIEIADFDAWTFFVLYIAQVH